MSNEISVESIKELRSKTGAGMMDCKKALQASEGKVDLAIEALRKKGLASAHKKSSRVTTEGLIASYIHAGSRVGVLVELNCETDFVARSDDFHDLAHDISMQLAASQSVEYVSMSDIPERIILQETNIEKEKDDIAKKPEEIKKQIIIGRIEKRLKELCLMDQVFIKDQSISVEELIKKKIVLMGENIKIRRFQRFILGEGLQRKSDNFTQEVSKMIYNN